MHHLLLFRELHHHLHVTDKEKTMECRVKIGSAYEPVWFERRYTQGTYSGKNVPLDQDAMSIQSCLIGLPLERQKSKKLPVRVASIMAVGLLFFWAYGAL
jgi:hypothetical protein